jgi:hypothetical protein
MAIAVGKQTAGQISYLMFADSSVEKLAFKRRFWAWNISQSWLSAFLSRRTAN